MTTTHKEHVELTAAEVAERLRITEKRAGTLLRRGEIPGGRKKLGRWLINRRVFDQWMGS